MTTHPNIAHQRLHNQFITQQTFEKAGDVVEWLGAVQAQDYAAAKWALGLRMQACTDTIIEQAFTDGIILRTHILRPTWHFVSPTDIRWLLALTSPRVNAGNSSWYRRLELDDALFMHSNAVLAKALQGGKQLTRAELVSVLQRASIVANNLLRFTYIIMRAELDGIICSGARRDKQFTYALLDERAPQARTLDRDEALAELARRYFTSHGPATLQDFAWWSGLPLRDVRAGAELAALHIDRMRINGVEYFIGASTPVQTRDSHSLHLLPPFDEYTVAYRDRSAAVAAEHKELASSGGVFRPSIVVDGQVVGTWNGIVKTGRL